MRVESLDAPSLLELQAVVTQRLLAYGAFDGHIAEDRRTILAQACMVMFHLTAGIEGRLLYLGHLGSPADGGTTRGYSTRWRAYVWTSSPPCRNTSPCGTHVFGQMGASYPMAGVL